MNKQFILKYEKKILAQYNVQLYNCTMYNQFYGKLYNNRSFIILFFFMVLVFIIL